MNPRCPHCNGEIQWEARRAGQDMTCPHCGNEFVMPVSPPPVHVAQPLMPVQQQQVYYTTDRGCGYTIARYAGLTIVGLFVLGIGSMIFVELSGVPIEPNRVSPVEVRPTMADYYNIRNGQTFEEVNEIIGFTGSVFSSGSSSGLTVYQWNRTDGEMGYITVGVENGKVVGKSCLCL